MSKESDDAFTMLGLAIAGALITGFFGILFAIISILGGNQIGADLCLVASALAFGLIQLGYRKS